MTQKSFHAAYSTWPQVHTKTELEPSDGREVRPCASLEHSNDRRVVNADILSGRTNTAIAYGGAHVQRKLTRHLADRIYRHDIGPARREFAGVESGGPGHVSSVDDRRVLFS